MTSHNDAKADGHGRIYQAAGDQHITEHHHHASEWPGPDSVRHPAVGRPPVMLRDRTGELDQLRAAVESDIGNGIYVLHGLGGCGKTAVAYIIFQHAGTNAGRVGLWVNASDPASLRAGMLAVAADRGATDAELIGARSGLRPAADLVWHYLDQSRLPWLLVIDNADTPAFLWDGGWLRTSPAGIVIVTSRRGGIHWWPGAQLLHLGVLPREDAAQVLRDLAPFAGTVEEATALADRLGRLPLALTLAGGFLAHQVIEPCTLAEYRHMLDSSADLDSIDLIDQGADFANEDNPRHLLSRTWQLSLDALTEHGLPEAAALLRLLACWAGDPLPIFLLSGAEQLDLPSARVESALRGLLDQSLTELASGTVRCLRTHSVLLDSVARRVTPIQREQVARTAAKLLSRHLPEFPDHGPQDSRMTLLAPHVIAFMRRAAEWKLSSDTVESAADCALRLIIAVHRSGGYAEALILAREASQLVSEYLGADHVQTLKIQQRVARAQWRLGQFEESRDLYIQVLSKCERVLGIGAQETLDSCNGLSCALRDLGDIAQSFVLQKRIAKNTIKAFGNLHPRALAARSHLIASAGQIADEEDVGEIIAAGVSLIDDCRRTVGDNHQITLSARLDYASALYSTGRAVEALGHVADVHAAFKAHLGLNHSLTLAAQRTYSGSLFLVGRYEEAIALAKDLAERRASVLGPRHPWTVENKELVEKFINAQNETDSQGPRLKNSIGLLQVTILCCFGGSAGSRGR